MMFDSMADLHCTEVLLNLLEASWCNCGSKCLISGKETIPFLNFAVLVGIRKHYKTGSLFVHYYLIKKKKKSVKGS